MEHSPQSFNQSPNNNYYNDMYLQSKTDSNRFVAINELPNLNKIKGIFLEHGITDATQQ